MSLFDVIKYPISIPPTKEEFEALPDEIYINWSQLTENSFIPKRIHTDNQNSIRMAKNSAVYWFNISVSADDRKDLELLRQMIKEYDEYI